MTQEFIEAYTYYDDEIVTLINVKFIINITVKTGNPQNLKIRLKPPFPERIWYILVQMRSEEYLILNPIFTNEEDAVSAALNLFPLLNVEHAGE